MIHPDTELQFINDTIGYGVVATKPIPAGTITWVLDKLDREFTPKKFEQMPKLYKDILDIYCYRNNKGNYILCWDNGRFINHSFRSNCMSTAYDFEVAIRDIAVGEQLTDDYGYLNVSEPFEAVDEGEERKVVYPDDLLHYASKWDAQVKRVFPLIPKLRQPLQPLLTPECWEKIGDIASGRLGMESIVSNYYDTAETQEHFRLNK